MWRNVLVVVAAALAAHSLAGASQPAAAGRWSDSLQAFERADRAGRPEAGGVLFVGSSSIRLWPRLPEEFRQVTVINRGFGGSTMADCARLARELVVQYRPRHVIVYAGDNDLAEGRTPQQVLESFEEFVRVVRSELPGSRISYISIKPSPLREPLLEKAREANALVASFIQSLPDASYIDVFTPMLDASGRPRADLYGPDGLHMNAAGYALWRQIISTHIVAGDAAAAPPSEPVTPGPR